MISTTTNQIITAFSGLVETRKVLLAKESVVDKEISHHYHVLEMITMPAPQISKVMKSLRTLLRDRRDVKESLALLNSALDGQENLVARISTLAVRRTKAVEGYRSEAVESFNRIMGIMK